MRGHDGLGGHSLGMVCEGELEVKPSTSRPRRPTGAAAPSTLTLTNFATPRLDAEVLLALHEKPSWSLTRHGRDSEPA